MSLENIRILEEEKIIENVNHHTSSYMAEKWKALADHPIVGEARIKGLMGALELTPNKVNKAQFEKSGLAGIITRNICIKNGLVMRAVGDKMIISPPLIITTTEIDELTNLVWECLDESQNTLKKEGLLKS